MAEGEENGNRTEVSPRWEEGFAMATLASSCGGWGSRSDLRGKEDTCYNPISRLMKLETPSKKTRYRREDPTLPRPDDLTTWRLIL